MSKICVMSSDHSANDIRIYLKEILSLKKAGFEVVYLNREKSGRDEKGVVFKKIKINKGALNRLLFTPLKMFRLAKKQSADAYHFHDPELLITGILLKVCGKKVIYDVHEDVPRQIINAHYLRPKRGKVIAVYYEILQRVFTRFFTMNIVAAPVVEEVFKEYKCKVICIKNYPKLEEFIVTEEGFTGEKSGVCYVGGINVQRGIFEMIEAVDLSDTVLKLVGGFGSSDLEKECISLSSWGKNIEYHGFVGREEVAKLMVESIAGLVVFLPLPNHTEAMPNKMFEYMAAGIPVIASNFPLWIEIVENGECGVCVDPQQPMEISRGITYLLENPKIAQKMGENGKKLVREKYNWGIEERKLLDFYKRLLL